FAPRGAYAASEARRRFFRAYRYAASALFPLAPSAALGLDVATGRRLLDQLRQLARLGAQPEPDQALAALQAGIADLLPGQSASVDLTFVRQAGARPDDALAWGRALLKRAQREGRQPRVLPTHIEVSKLEPGLTARDAVTGYRFAPLMEALDSRIFQRLVYDATGVWRGSPAVANPLGLGTVEGFGPAKVRPLADEWVAALGVAPLQRQLAERGETAFERYPGWSELRKVATGGRGLERQRVRLFTAYLALPGADWPQRVETVKGMWSEFKHAELLYQVQSHTATGKGLAVGDDDSAVRGATIEPIPQAIAALRQFGGELAGRLPEPLRPRWTQLGDLLQQAEMLAAARAAGKPLTLEQQAFLRGLPPQLDALAGLPSEPLVVDIHSGEERGEPDILHAATGFAREAVMQVDGRPYRGARYRFFGFRDRRRWTDEAWRDALAVSRAGQDRQSWRLKSTAPLVRAVVLARADRDDRPQPLEVVLTDPAAASQLDAWTAERKLKAEHRDVHARLALPLSQVPALAQQPWVAHIAPPGPPLEPLQQAPDSIVPPPALPVAPLGERP
ncbi:MAG: DUF3160 domain-containing protein, partial [Candidatus Competibacter phosphatis]